MQFISHGQSLSLKASFEIELNPLDFNMVSEPSLGCWADLPPNYGPRVWLVRHTWGGMLKWESCPTLTKYSWVVQFISHGQFSSLKASFEIKLGPLDFNKYFGTLIFLGRSPPQLWFTCLVGPPHVRGHVKVRVLSHIDQVFLGCAIYKSWTILISQGIFWDWVRPIGL